MSRRQFAIQTVGYWAKEYPIRFTLWIVACDAATTAGAYWLSSEVQKDRGLIVGGAVLLGLLLALAVLFLCALLSAPRRDLALKVASLAEIVQGLQAQLAALTQEKFGPPLQFLPIYEELRVDVREAIRRIERAQETGRLWDRTESPDYRRWNKHRQAIATNPWAQIDGIHGELVEAFDHCQRLATSTSIRFDRRVRESDDLDEALDALGVADAVLTASIDRLSALQSPEGNQLNLEDQP